MHTAEDFDEIHPTCFYWQCYDPSVKADLCSSALLTDQGLVIIDPVPLDDEGVEHLRSIAPPLAVVLTNGNHARGADHFRQTFSIPVYAHPDAIPELGLSDVQPLPEASELGLTRLVPLPGFGPGETALHLNGSPSTLVVGDALIHMGSYGFTFLPAKYCQNLKQGKHSLKALMEIDFDVLCFAHGTPLTGLAKEKLQQLLENENLL